MADKRINFDLNPVKYSNELENGFARIDSIKGLKMKSLWNLLHLSMNEVDKNFSERIFLRTCESYRKRTILLTI